METKFTKGKWEINPRAHLNIRNDKNRSIASTGVYSDNTNSELVDLENKANALLISKAPEMFEMLEGILQRREVCFEDLIEIEQLLKEATEL